MEPTVDVRTDNAELAEVRAEVGRLRADLDQLQLMLDALCREDEPNPYVPQDNDADARAFDDFCRAYDEGHGKPRRKFLRR